MFFRKNPDNGGLTIFAGLQQLIEAVKDMHFTEGDIEYLRERGSDCIWQNFVKIVEQNYKKVKQYA